MSEVKVGKYTLESLTTGMYEQPLVIFREYIQNSADAIDLAIKNGILNRESALIDVILNQREQMIEVIDNGSGIPKDLVYSKLTNIGDSDKDHAENRGFRGIGRLAGYAYCDTLVFETSFKGEPVRSVFTIDCKLMRDMLIPGQYENLEARDVITSVSTLEFLEEECDKHFFTAKLLDVNDEMEDILLIEKVYDYLCQVAPVQFDRTKFTFVRDIEEFYSQHGVELSEYRISIGPSLEELRPIYKPYAGYIPYKKGLVDDIQQIVPLISKDDHGVKYIGWYSQSDLLGTCIDDRMKGFRLRKGNILVGNNATLSKYFVEERFNSYFVGEIHVIDPKIIPNARRDNFEPNKGYNEALELLKLIFTDLSAKIRAVSKERNRKEVKLNAKLSVIESEVKKIKVEGATSNVRVKKIHNKLDTLINDINKMPTKKDENKIFVRTMIDRVRNVEEKLGGDIKYKSWEIPSSYSRKERKLLQQVFETIDEVIQSEEESAKLIDKILSKLNR